MNKNKTKPQALTLATGYLSYQARTIYEMENYLKKKGVVNDIIQETITYLVNKNYLNDMEFARLFVEIKTNNKPKSKFAMAYELKKKGIAPSKIDMVLEPYDDQALAVKAIEPKIRMWQSLDMEKFKKKMMNFLRYRGFNYDTCMSTLDLFLKQKESMEKEPYED